MLSGISKGLLVGAGNVVAVAITLGAVVAIDPRYAAVAGAVDGESLELGARQVAHAGASWEVAVLVVCIGLVPGLIAGALAAALARALARRGRPVRLLALGALAVLAVVVLGALTLQLRFIGPALVPTAIAAAVLERWLRRGLPPALPAARALATSAAGPSGSR